MTSRSLRVLVIDDDAGLAGVVGDLFAELGHEVELALGGRQALACFEGGRSFELVLCDLGMPGIDGWQVARAIRDRAPRSAIYILSGGADLIGSADPRRGFVDGVLAKPVELSLLERLVEEAIAKGDGREQ